tara:strand:- start:1261 stop:3219 length:1959 start_codon:yes stop_codon:yes gene_type:complete
MALPINDNTVIRRYTATAGQTVFAVPYEFFEVADLKVYNDGVLLTYSASPADGTEYSVTGAGVEFGGNITLGTGGATAGDVITIARDVLIERVSDFPLSGPFQIEALNTELARLFAITQRHETLLETRVLGLEDFDGPTILSSLPIAATRASKYLGFDADGQVQMVSGVGDLALRSELIGSTGATIVGTASGGTVQGQLDAVREAAFDLVDFAGLTAAPALSDLRRTVNTTAVTPSGDMVIEVAGGYFGNSFATGRGAAYLVAPTDAPVVYFKGSFVIESGGASSPDQAVFAMMPWVTDITQTDPFQVPATGAHMTFTQTGWTVDEVLTAGGAITTYASGSYPSGVALEEDVEYTVEVAIVDGTLYRFFNGEPMDLVSRASLSTLIGNFAGFEIFKNNTNDNEPKMRRLVFSNSEVEARAVRERYLAQVSVGANVQANDLLQIRDDFIFNNTETGEIGELGWNFTNYVVAEASGLQGHPGTIALSTNASSGQFCALHSRTATNILAVSMLDFKESTWIFRENAAGITDMDFRIGQLDTFAAAPANGFYLEKLAADVTWFLVTRIGGVQTRLDTTVASRVNDWLTLRLIKRTNGRYACGIKVNGGTETVTDDILTNLPASNVLTSGCVSVNTGTTTRRMDIDYFSLSYLASAR